MGQTSIVTLAKRFAARSILRTLLMQAAAGCSAAGGVHINTVSSLPQNGQRGGVVTAAQYDSVLERVRDALLAARDPETGEPVVTEVYRADEQTENGLGGPHGADLYLELAPGYYWSSDVESGPIVEASEPFTTGIHGVPTVDNDTIRGYAVLGGDGPCHVNVASTPASC